MNLNSSLYLKWMDAKDPKVQGADLRIINLCVLASKNAEGFFTGLTIFEPKDFSEKFLNRLSLRRKKEEFSHSQFVLYLPPVLKHRAQTLLKSQSDLQLETVYSPFVNVKHGGDRFFVRTSLRVVTVDDSPVILKFLKKVMQEIGYIEVVAQVSDSLQAVDTIEKFKPDFVTLDIQMPKKTGVEVLKDLLTKNHYPVLMISSVNLEEGSLVFEALNNGAFDYIQKPGLEDKDSFREELGLKALHAIEGKNAHSALLNKKYSDKVSFSESYPENLIWCLGASTGGTQALTRVFTNLPAQVPPTLVVQHIPPLFSKAFAESLNHLVPFSVKEAENGEPILSNHVYIAPGGMQMGIEKRLGRFCISLQDSAPVNRFKPSVDYLFSEVAKLQGLHIVAGVLTGMGRDGAKGLLELKKNGARTFAQDEESSAVFGMPRSAFELGAAEELIHLDKIAQVLLNQSLHYKNTG
jgi:two-component system chemotaxis response regulator CheB